MQLTVQIIKKKNTWSHYASKAQYCASLCTMLLSKHFSNVEFEQKKKKNRFPIIFFNILYLLRIVSNSAYFFARLQQTFSRAEKWKVE